MKKISKTSVLKTLLIALSVLVYPFAVSISASAAPITNRTVALGSSVASASTTYNFTFTAGSATTIKSIGFAACTTASGACTPAPGFSSSTSTLSGSSNLGSGGSWTVNTSTAGELRMLNASNTGAPSAGITANFASVITTYSDATWTTPIDTGVIALSTSIQIQVSLQVDETLTFCTGTSITGTNCGTASGSVVNLGIGSTSTPATGTSIMAASTNATGGYSITVNGSTLTSGANTIAPMAGGVSTVGSSQFGLNLVLNTTPAVGANVSSGAGAFGAPDTGYGTTNNFRFNTGDKVAISSGATNANTFTVSYLANIAGLTPAGVYNTVLTYIATANF